MSPASADIVVALGGGITADGEPGPATVARARHAAGLYLSGRAARIVMSGAYGMYDPPPPRAEAAAMAEIAVAAGVPPDSITAETRSRDTIGNIWFTKALLGEPAGQVVTVVTSDWHVARVRYLAQFGAAPDRRFGARGVLSERVASGAPTTGLCAWLGPVRAAGDDALLGLHRAPSRRPSPRSPPRGPSPIDLAGLTGTPIVQDRS